MITTAVQEFLNRVGEDEALQAELAKAMEAENDRQAVTDLAQSKGYNFTPDELWAEVQKRQAEAEKKLEAGELSNEELEAVAGGLFAPHSNDYICEEMTLEEQANMMIKAKIDEVLKW